MAKELCEHTKRGCVGADRRQYPEAIIRLKPINYVNMQMCSNILIQRVAQEPRRGCRNNQQISRYSLPNPIVILFSPTSIEKGRICEELGSDPEESNHLFEQENQCAKHEQIRAVVT